MKIKMKNILTFLIVLTAVVSAYSKDAVFEKPFNPTLPTSFGIIIDEDTYNAVMPSLNRYRQAVESDGLATYAVHSDWSSPDEVREAINRLGKEVPTLEGFVLVGDIPVAMVRNAQHNTTAFKMDEDAYPFIESSVPSDRFYDDPALTFRFINRDKEHPHLFYYELEETSPQWVNPKWYSSRIRYPKSLGGDAHKSIARFLDKAASAKDGMKSDRLDRLVVFNGHGYNSDCLVAWMDEEKAYRENFPAAFEKASGLKHWNFRMHPKMKYRLFEELARPGTDVFMFHEHGAPTTQYINGSEPGPSMNERVEDFRKGIYWRVRREVSKGKPLDSLKNAYEQKYGLTSEFFHDFDNPDFWKADSTEQKEVNIDAVELHGRITNPKMVMFNACYNGSFHEDDYIAGDYLFNDGATLVTQGNTRNVLQDRWTLEMVGLLSHGIRAGHYNRMIASLEGHMQGDPTVRFAPISQNSIAEAITLEKSNDLYWRGLLESPYADLRMLAMRMLADNDSTGSFSPELLKIYKTTPYNTVRMEAVKLLSRYNNSDFLEAVKLGVNDPYELIARLSSGYAGNIGDKTLLPILIEAFCEGGERQRVSRSVLGSLVLFNPEDVAQAVNRYFEGKGANRIDAAKDKKEFLEWLQSQKDYVDRSNAIMTDKGAKDKTRISRIRSVRNNPYHHHLDKYFSIISDTENPDSVRVNMIEALGWFVNSCRRPEILAFCNDMLGKGELPENVRLELIQTINRLK